VVQRASTGDSGRMAVTSVKQRTMMNTIHIEPGPDDLWTAVRRKHRVEVPGTRTRPYPRLRAMRIATAAAHASGVRIVVGRPSPPLNRNLKPVVDQS